MPHDLDPLPWDDGEGIQIILNLVRISDTWWQRGDDLVPSFGLHECIVVPDQEPVTRRDACEFTIIFDERNLIALWRQNDCSDVRRQLRQLVQCRLVIT